MLLPCLTPNLDAPASMPTNVQFLEKYFHTNDIITYAMLKIALKIALVEQNVEHIVISLISELLLAFFFATTFSSISSTLVKLYTDLESIKKFALAEMLLKALKNFWIMVVVKYLDVCHWIWCVCLSFNVVFIWVGTTCKSIGMIYRFIIQLHF